MPTIDENQQRWNTYDWKQGGDEWSKVWGGTPYLWWGAIYPRIQHLLPGSTILEIAPGFGRFTQYLKELCDELILVDLSERCIAACRDRFQGERHISYHVGDGRSLAAVPDAKVDFVFSFDSLVHCEADVLAGYLSDLPKKLTASGRGFFHHSNLAAFVDATTGEIPFENRHWRGRSVSAEGVKRICQDSGLACVSQELVNWGSEHLTDCLTTFAMPGSAVAVSAQRVRENPRFMEEAIALGRIAEFAGVDGNASTELPGAAPSGAVTSRVGSADDSTTLTLLSFETPTEYQDWRSKESDALLRLRKNEMSRATPGRSFEIRAQCHVCSQPSPMTVTWDYAFEQSGVLTPNWREQLCCPRCELNARMRATVHILEARFGSLLGADCYITEQASKLFQVLHERYPGVLGSEFLRDGTAPGDSNAGGLRHENFTALSFEDGSLDLIVSLDVLEHVPAYQRALGEAHRVLRPGGTFFFSAPFLPDAESNLVRARVREDGSVEHLLPAEYHYDPLSETGALAYYQFGWELLEATREAGFSNVRALLCHSLEFGYLGPYHLYFCASKV